MRVRNQRGVVMPSPVIMLSVIAVAMAGIAFVATRGGEPTEREVTTVRVAKSESRETTFDSDLRGLEVLEPVLERLARELCATLAKQDARGRTIGIKVRLDDFSTHTRARTREDPTHDVDVVTRTARELLREFDPPRPVRLLGVRVAGLDEVPGARRAPRAAGAGQLELAL